MIERIFTDYRAGAITSLFSAGASEAAGAVGHQTTTLMSIQAIAAIVAIIAGIVAIVNGCDSFYKNHYKHEKNSDKR